MHFVRESFRRKPLESKALVCNRGIAAVLLGLSFLSYCGYLIFEMISSGPLVKSSVEYIDDELVPFINFCSSNSTLTIVSCILQYDFFLLAIAPDCAKDLIEVSDTYGGYTCYLFNPEKAAGMEDKLDYLNEGRKFSPSHHVLTNIRLFWKFDDLSNATYISPQVPSITLELIKGDFTNFYTSKNLMTEYLPERTLVTSLMNYYTDIYYQPTEYRNIRNSDWKAFFGVKPNFDVTSMLKLETFRTPLQQTAPHNAYIDRGLYHGVFSVRKDGDRLEIETEVLRHNVFSSIASAGGAYSVLTGIYVLLFGMPKVSPWGLAHVIPMYLKRKQQSKKNDEENGDSANDKLDDGLNSKTSKRSSINDSLLPRILNPTTISERNSFPVKVFTPPGTAEMTNTYSNVSQEESFILPTRIDIDESNTVTKNVLLYDESDTSSQQDSKKLAELRKETAMLASELKELKIALSGYYIDTKYMDQLRFIKKSTLSSDD